MTLSSIRKHHDDAHFCEEMVKKFESGTRELGIPHNRSLSHEDAATAPQRRPKFMITGPKEHELQTPHKICAIKVKNSAKLEEEMLAKIPKFGAQPFNNNIVGAAFPPPQGKLYSFLNSMYVFYYHDRMGILFI